MNTYTPKLLNKILNSDLRAKVTNEVSTMRIENGDKMFSKGSVIVPIQNQALSKEEMYKRMQLLSEDCHVDIYSINTAHLVKVSIWVAHKQ